MITADTYAAALGSAIAELFEVLVRLTENRFVDFDTLTST